jgi:hypothetical protein
VADRIEPFSVPIPAGTLTSAPLVTDLDFADGEVVHITIIVPPGPSGFVGFQFTHLGGPVIPYTGNNFIIADDQRFEWDVSNMPSATGWQMRAYNTDIFQHTLYVIFMIDEIPVGIPPRTPIVQI